MDAPTSANDASFSSQRARSVPVLSSMSTIRGYPSKLKIFRIPGSRFWQMRCYIAGHMYVRSTRSQEKQHAIEAAKQFYDELLLNHRNRGEDSPDGPHRPTQNAIVRSQLTGRIDRAAGRGNINFRTLAERALETERGRMMRGELAMQSFRALRNRLQKQIYPAFGKLSMHMISHQHLQQFMQTLVQRQASSVTIAQYLHAIKLVFKHGLIEGLIDRIPPFPKLRLSSQPRGGFTVAEYRSLL